MDLLQANKKIKNLLEVLTRKLFNKLTLEEKHLIEFYREVLKDIKSQLSEMYLEYGANVNYSEMARYNRLTNLDNSIAYEIGKIFKLSRTEINSFLSENFVLSYNGVEKILNESMNFVFSFQTISLDVIKAAIENTDDKFSPLNLIKWKDSLEFEHQVAAKKIQNEIAQGIIQGKGFSRTADAIKKNVEQLTNDVMRIVRTETHRIQTKGRLRGYEEAEKSFKKLGLKYKKVLISIIDNRTRTQSIDMDGQKADKNGMFTYPNLKGHVKAPGPGLSGVAKWDINDREQVIIELI